MFGWAGSSLLCTGFLQLLRAGPTLPCEVQASQCGGFFCGVGAQVLSPRASGDAAHGSVAVAPHSLRNLPTYEIFPDQGLIPHPLYWQVDS